MSSYFTLISFIFIISTAYLVDNVISLNVEEINGGIYPERQIEFSYVVGILVPDYSLYPFQLIGTGNLIATNFALSIAELFVDDNGILIPRIYSVTCATNNWKFNPGTVVLLYKIYLPPGNNYHSTNNIAVLQLMGHLPILDNPLVSKLDISLDTNRFYDTVGKVAGYGYSWVTVVPARNGTITRIDGDSEHYLKYGLVHMTRNNNCKINDLNIDTDTHFCGNMAAMEPFEESGICVNDLGSAFVTAHMIIGLAVAHREDCNDSTTPGSSYIKVSNHASFINSIIYNRILPNAVVRDNPLPVGVQVINQETVNLAAPAA